MDQTKPSKDDKEAVGAAVKLAKLTAILGFIVLLYEAPWVLGALAVLGLFCAHTFLKYLFGP